MDRGRLPNRDGDFPRTATHTPRGRETTFGATGARAFARLTRHDLTAATMPSDGSCKPKVLVTGISGYVASHVAKAALAAGYDVKGTVRSAKLNAPLSAALPGVELVELDLLSASIDDVTRALDGCQYIAHVASPLPGVTVNADQVTHPHPCGHALEPRLAPPPTDPRCRCASPSRARAPS